MLREAPVKTVAPPHPSSCARRSEGLLASADDFDVQELPPTRASGLPGGHGVAVSRVTDHGAAAQAGLKTMLPWVLDHVAEADAMMGKDFWPYGVEPNLHGLSTFLRYSHEQGLAKRLLTPQELFVPEALEAFKI